tara:strand:+ start:99 stop:386 length:288 start_codon:yes stop_codon:yes gene_type:complete
MCKNIVEENRKFWEARDKKSRAARVNGKIPGQKGVTIGAPQKSPQPKKKEDNKGPAPSPPVRKKEKDEKGPAPSPKPTHTGKGWNAWRAGNRNQN